MNLLYIWNEAYPNTNGNAGYLLSSRYQIKFTRQNERLSICRRSSLSEDGFWGKHIYDVMAVVGNNGAGKTRLAYCIMETLEGASRLMDSGFYSRQSQFPFILVFEDNCCGESVIKILTTISDLSVGSKVRYEHNSSWDDLKHFKFAYFTDTLTLTDYMQKKYGVVYDGSLGGGIRKAFEFNLEMHYIDNAMNPVINYFDDEMWKILEFICMNQNQVGIPFHLPKTATFSTKDYRTNLDYITDELKHMGKPDGEEILTKKCYEIRETYGACMSSALAIHLMLNLFKAVCIPQTTSEHLQGKAEMFLEKIDRLEFRDGETAFDLILRLLEQLSLRFELNLILSYREMVLWLKKQPALQSPIDSWSLDLAEELQVIKELQNYYYATRFPFPYLSISFGLSSGEYALLRRFVRVNELLVCDSGGRSNVINNMGYEVKCDGLMLYFDEADQSLHPEWQRKQLDWLLQFVSSKFETCASQLIIATHSPIVLSDMPCEHVLYLQNNEGRMQVEQREVRTFGSNIHTLFRDAFFLNDGTMGAFAERKINEIACSLQGNVSAETKKLIEEIGDDIIRNKLRQMSGIGLITNFRPMTDEALEKSIHLLREEIERMNAVVQKLESMRDDKN